MVEVEYVYLVGDHAWRTEKDIQTGIPVRGYGSSFEQIIIDESREEYD